MEIIQINNHTDVDHTGQHRNPRHGQPRALQRRQRTGRNDLYVRSDAQHVRPD